MSYILEALKKSEQQRRQGKIPDLQTEHSDSNLPLCRHRSVTPWVLLAALLLNAGLLFWWLTVDPVEPVGSQVVAPVPEAVRPTPAPESPALAAATPATSAALETAQTPPAAASAPSVTATSPEGSIARRFAAGSLRSPEATLPQAGRLPDSATTAPLIDSAVQYIAPYADLTQAQRTGLPDLQLSLHYFTAQPERRLARLNGRNIREGGLVEPGVVLEEIRPEGVVISYRQLLILLPRP